MWVNARERKCKIPPRAGGAARYDHEAHGGAGTTHDSSLTIRLTFDRSPVQQLLQVPSAFARVVASPPQDRSLVAPHTPPRAHDTRPPTGRVQTSIEWRRTLSAHHLARKDTAHEARSLARSHARTHAQRERETSLSLSLPPPLSLPRSLPLPQLSSGGTPRRRNKRAGWPHVPWMTWQLMTWMAEVARGAQTRLAPLLALALAARARVSASVLCVAGATLPLSTAPQHWPLPGVELRGVGTGSGAA